MGKGYLMRTIELTDSEWQSLSDIHQKIKKNITSSHRAKFLLLGLASEQTGSLVITFEGRLQLREYQSKTS